MVETIDITTTATLRPDILDITYNSFCSKLFNNNFDYRLIINIDPIGDKRYCQNDVLNIAKKYFKDITHNFPKSPSFTKSVKWCWNNTKSKYVFHLEDDWILNKNINMSNLINIINHYKNMAMIRLYKGKFSWKMKLLESDIIEDREFIKILPKRCCLNPCLFLGEYVREASAIMMNDFNPESQLCYGFTDEDIINLFIQKWEYSIYGYGEKIVTDIGRAWRRKIKIRRKSDFTEWRF